MTEPQYTLTESQFIAAQRLHVSLRSPAQRLMRWLTLLLGMALVAGSLYEGLYWLTAGGLIAILSPWLSWAFTTLPRLMQAYRSSPALHQLNRLALGGRAAIQRRRAKPERLAVESHHPVGRERLQSAAVSAAPAFHHRAQGCAGSGWLFHSAA